MRSLSMVLVLVGLLAMAQLSMQQSSRNFIGTPEAADRINGQQLGLGAFGIIVTSRSAEKALNDSGLFFRESHVDLLGRRFVTGKIYAADVVYVKSAATPSVHVAITLQILVKNFNIRGIVSFGSAGTTNETISIGTVVVPGLFAFPGAFQWLSKDSKKTGQLNIGDFNYPNPGRNLLGSFSYEKIDLYLENSLESRYYIPVSPGYILFAGLIKSFESIDIVVGLNATSSDIYIKNSAYREFLYKTFRASTVDTSGIALGLGALSNDLPYIVFQGVSNKAGAGSGESNSTLANANAFRAAARFIYLRRCY